MHLAEQAVDALPGDLVVARPGQHIHHQTDGGHDEDPAEERQSLEERIPLQRDGSIASRENAHRIDCFVPLANLPG